jgi:hypothetical protein
MIPSCAMATAESAVQLPPDSKRCFSPTFSDALNDGMFDL